MNILELEKLVLQKIKINTIILICMAGKDIITTFPDGNPEDNNGERLAPFLSIDTKEDFGVNARDLLGVHRFFRGALNKGQIGSELVLFVNQLARTQEPYVVARDYSRRNLLRKGLAIGLSFLTFGTGVLLVQSASNPEAIAQRQAAQKAAEAENQRLRLEFERTRVLGSNPSALSREGWTVRTLAPGEQVPQLEAVGIERVMKDQSIHFGLSGFIPNGISINLADYKRVDGIYVPLLTVVAEYSRAGPSLRDPWILDNPSDEASDTWKKIVFEHYAGAKVDDRRYIDMKRITALSSNPTNSVYYEVTQSRVKK